MSMYPVILVLINQLLLLVTRRGIGADARAVNISDTWFLPQERFPLFYRYFKDKVTWDEAQRICNSHRGNLLSLNRDDKRDVVRAYLKELDVITHVWLGLKKEVQHEFLWMHGEQIRGDGYWLEPIPKSDVRLCAAIDPASDYRWISYHCSGPETASFICELKVPEWANNENGCMITELPSLSITLEPDMGVIELISECGLAGTRRIACKGRINREDAIKHLSCDEDPFTDRSITDNAKESSSPHSSTTKTYSKDGISQQTTKGWSWTPTERLTRH